MYPSQTRYSTRQRQREKQKAEKELNTAYVAEQQKYLQEQIDKINNAAEKKQSALA